MLVIELELKLYDTWRFLGLCRLIMSVYYINRCFACSII